MKNGIKLLIANYTARIAEVNEQFEKAYAEKYSEILDELEMEMSTLNSVVNDLESILDQEKAEVQ